MKPFRLFHLPHLLFRKISSEINLVALSLCSKRSRLAVKSTGIKPIRLSKKHHSTHNSVILEFECYWVFWPLKKRNEVEDFKQFSVECKIGEQVFKTKYDGDWDVFTSICTDYYTAADQLVDYLRSTFNCELTKYSISLSGYPEYRQLISQTINNSKCSEMDFGEGDEEMQREDIDFIINNLKTNKQLTIGCRLADDYQLQKPLNFQYFLVFSARWFRPEDLFKENCEHLSLLNAPKLKPADINWYLKQWINGEHSKMLFLRVESVWLYSIHPDRNQQLFDGIQRKPFDTERIISCYKKSVFNNLLSDQCKKYEFWDIHRNDGTIGSIALNQHGCFFHVWRLK